jgi:anti-anti-sigma regulatory factor
MDDCVLRVNGPLYQERGRELRHEVQLLLGRSPKVIRLSLAEVSDIDAAGLGELVRIHNLAVAARRGVRITGATTHVRAILDRVGLLEILGRAA